MRRADWISLVGWIVVSQLAGAIGAIGSRGAGTFYQSLARPSWAPPSSVFGPVWTTLYLLMGIAAWMVWRAGPGPARRMAITLFAIQLAINALWSWTFFTWRSGSWAFIVVIALLAAIVATAVAFGRVRTTAALLLVPYLAWVTFASALTWSIWRANPDQL